MMKKLITILLFIIPVILSAQDIGGFYVAHPDSTYSGMNAASDRTGDGSYLNPWASMDKAFDEIEALNIVWGDTVYFRGGVYNQPAGKISLEVDCSALTGSDTLKLWNYPNEEPIFDRDTDRTTGTAAIGFGAEPQSNYIKYLHLKGITVRNVWQLLYGSSVFGIDSRVQYSIIENCKVYNIHGEAFNTANYSHQLKYLNCDAWNCNDSLSGTGGELDPAQPGNDGAGFALAVAPWVETQDTLEIYFEGCRAWNCSDQGWMYNASIYVENKNCYSFFNGALSATGTGFKHGYKPAELPLALEPNIYFENCMAAFNKTYGFSTNDRDKWTYGVNIYNSIAYKNGYNDNNTSVTGVGFYVFNGLEDEADENRLRQFYNNISYNNLSADYAEATGATSTNITNSWNTPPGITVTDDDFVSVDTAGMLAPRQADGSLPDNNFYNNFMRLAPTSGLIDAGTDVGMSTTPDIGFDWEYLDGITPAAVSRSPISFGTGGIRLFFNGKYLK